MSKKHNNFNNKYTTTAANTTTEFQFYAPKEKLSFNQFLYNSKNGTYLGRTPASWGKILIFYCLFYTVLAGLFTVCIQVLFSTLSATEPKWKLEESLIGTNPGLGFRPLSDETERGSVIQFDSKKPQQSQYWVNLINEFLQPYNSTGKQEKFCEFDMEHKPQDVCAVDLLKLKDCSPEHNYGYKNNRPCVFLKLNKIYNWLPDYYDDPKDLPAEMPMFLKKRIQNITDKAQLRQIWISCDGTHAEDREKVGNINYFPSQGFPFYYYPYLNQPGYLSPFIAVQFENLTPNHMVNVECRAWAKNILYSGSARDRMGSVTFQLFID